MMAFSTVVLPVPGPPVMMERFRSIATSTPRLCRFVKVQAQLLLDLLQREAPHQFLPCVSMSLAAAFAAVSTSCMKIFGRYNRPPSETISLSSAICCNFCSTSARLTCIWGSGISSLRNCRDSVIKALTSRYRCPCCRAFSSAQIIAPWIRTGSCGSPPDFRMIVSTRRHPNPEISQSRNGLFRRISVQAGPKC